jgi:hypothetical protein
MTNFEQRGAPLTRRRRMNDAIGETRGDEPECASDVEVVASDIRSDLERDSDEEQQVSDIAEDVDHVEAFGPRGAQGTHLVYRNGYFYMVNARAYPDCKMVLVQKWVPELDRRTMSKALTIHHCNTDVSSPARTQLALRAWMLWRADANDLLDKKALRRRWWEAEIEQLRIDARALKCGDGRTGSGKGDAHIEQWCPRAFSST